MKTKELLTASAGVPSGIRRTGNTGDYSASIKGVTGSAVSDAAVIQLIGAVGGITLTVTEGGGRPTI